MRNPTGILGQIVARKRQDVARREEETPIATLRAKAGQTTRSLQKALSAPGVRFIFECKKASPSKGLLRADFDPRALARAYSGVADAVSVLCDEPFFQGSLAFLSAVREETDAAVLCKDFVVSPYQVVEARAYGADAILLMLSVLDDEEAALCLEQCRALGMDALVEVHDEDEMRRALALDAPILGINARDLGTLEVDLATIERLAPRVPKDRLVVAESGIEGRGDIARLAPIVDAFLVGTSLMRAPDVGDAARALATGRVKICGLRTREDAEAAQKGGARFGGLVFAEASKRRVSMREAEAMRACERLPLVGVFLDQPPSLVAEAARALALAAVQLHGDEDASFVAALREKLPLGCAVWKAIAMSSSPPPSETGGQWVNAGADRVLFDSRTKTARGGTGVAFDWSLLREHPDSTQSILAGGIRPENAALARAVGTWAIDVASGVEDADGRKSHETIARLFENLRGPSRHDTTERQP